MNEGADAEFPELRAYSPEQLLILYGAILDEFSHRGIGRTSNNPLSGYSEWLIAERLGLKLCPNSQKGCDAVGKKDAMRYEIKARRITPQNTSRQLSAIRDLDHHLFDFLIAVVFDEYFELLLGLKVPHDVVVKHSTIHGHTNSRIFHARDSLRNEPGVEDITHLLR